MFHKIEQIRSDEETFKFLCAVYLFPFYSFLLVITLPQGRIYSIAW